MRYIFCDSPTNSSDAVWDREISEEIAFHRKREPEPSTKVRVTDQARSSWQEFAALKLLNQKMKEFWATR